MFSLTMMIQSEREPVSDTLEKEEKEVNSRGNKVKKRQFKNISNPPLHLLSLGLPIVQEVLTAMF